MAKEGQGEGKTEGEAESTRGGEGEGQKGKIEDQGSLKEGRRSLKEGRGDLRRKPEHEDAHKKKFTGHPSSGTRDQYSEKKNPIGNSGTQFRNSKSWSPNLAQSTLRSIGQAEDQARSIEVEGKGKEKEKEEVDDEPLYTVC
jgi:hypothetical protein